MKYVAYVTLICPIFMLLRLSTVFVVLPTMVPFPEPSSSTESTCRSKLHLGSHFTEASPLRLQTVLLFGAHLVQLNKLCFPIALPCPKKKDCFSPALACIEGIREVSVDRSVHPSWRTSHHWHYA